MAPCPECHGDSYHIYTGGPGRYSHSFGNYLPSETEVACERCEGAGEVPVDGDACPNCGADPLLVYNAEREPYNPHAFICQACGHEWEEAAAPLQPARAA
jgi:RecJ-like exonuclease